VSSQALRQAPWLTQRRIAVRRQHATLQRWEVDVPWAAGALVVGHGDLAGEAGPWPVEAARPSDVFRTP
jgi:hypothetical protein